MRWLGPWWLYAIAAGGIVGGALHYSIVADADPADPVLNYAAVAADAICSTLDEYPTLPGVSGVISAVEHDSGFDVARASKVVVLAVESTCPRHLPLLDRFVATWAPATTQAQVIV